MNKTMEKIGIGLGVAWTALVTYANIDQYNGAKDAINELHKVSPGLTSREANINSGGLGELLTSIPYTIGDNIANRQYLKNNPVKENMWSEITEKEINAFYGKKTKLYKQ